MPSPPRCLSASCLASNPAAHLVRVPGTPPRPARIPPLPFAYRYIPPLHPFAPKLSPASYRTNKLGFFSVNIVRTLLIVATIAIAISPPHLTLPNRPPPLLAASSRRRVPRHNTHIVHKHANEVVERVRTRPELGSSGAVTQQFGRIDKLNFEFV
ncbi:hypothetical protein RHS01_05595 [Rhizoctonia solani]|uniref:Uncharacterized protein n=1 Tax=Rhizoctonia solani TaxID=456999 RepID=A0A8H7M4Q3_9AGAM|nr:hypothetical protein RHS01_05595 [Rhizoctonia solani]